MWGGRLPSRCSTLPDVARRAAPASGPLRRPVLRAVPNPPKDVAPFPNPRRFAKTP